MKCNCFIIKWDQIPQPIRQRLHWRNAVIGGLLDVSLYREFRMQEYRQGMSALEDYWNDQKNTNNFQGSLEDFITKYRLEFDLWLISQNFDLENVDKILVAMP